MSAWLTTQVLEQAAHKWRALAERRRAYLEELYESGRWPRYSSEGQMLDSIREATRQAERWSAIAPHAAPALAEPERALPDHPLSDRSAA